MNPTELEVSRRLGDRVTIAHGGFAWQVHCHAVERTAEAVKTTGALTVAAIVASITNSTE